MGQNIQLEVIEEGSDMTLNVIYLDTGEIHQRKLSKQEFFRRLFIYNEWAKQGLNVESILLIRSKP
jgi:hypothetical protein